MTPSGFKIRMEKHPGAPSWRIIGTRGEGTVCHKPCTVSGGGKSEISKSLRDYMLYGPIFVADVEKDLDIVDQIFSERLCDAAQLHRFAGQAKLLEEIQPLDPRRRTLAGQRDQAAHAQQRLHG